MWQSHQDIYAQQATVMFQYQQAQTHWMFSYATLQKIKNDLSENNTWPSLPRLVKRGTKRGPNPHYWPPRQSADKWYRPCRVLLKPVEEIE